MRKSFELGFCSVVASEYIQCEFARYISLLIYYLCPFYHLFQVKHPNKQHTDLLRVYLKDAFNQKMFA